MKQGYRYLFTMSKIILLKHIQKYRMRKSFFCKSGGCRTNSTDQAGIEF